MRIRSGIYYWYAIFVIAYLLLSIVPAPDKTTLIKYHLSATGLRLLDITLLLPIFATWFAACYSYNQLRRYNQTIKGTKDGAAITQLKRGLLVLALGLPLASILGAVLTTIANRHASFEPAATIVGNYLGVAYPLLAFSYIGLGTRRLSELTKKRPSYLHVNLIAVMLIVLGVAFCDLIARAHNDIRLSYHMSYSLVMLTLAIPYMYIWFLGLLAVAELYVYGRKVAGVLYRRSWQLFAAGLGFVIVVDIILQYLGTLSSWVGGLSLSGLLLLLYVLLFALAAAFIVMALGTKKLMKIEEV